MPRARVFFALWPDKRCADRLQRVAEYLASRLGGRTMKKETLHLTLNFVGDVSADRLPDLLALGGETAEEIKTQEVGAGASGHLRLDRLGYWQHNGIVWIGSSHYPPVPAKIANLLALKLSGRGYPIPLRPFAPHITLLRNVRLMSGAAELETLEYRNRDPASRPIVWPYRDFVLVRSRLSRSGPDYERLGCWPLPHADVEKLRIPDVA